MAKTEHLPKFDDADLSRAIEAGRRRRAGRLHAVSASYLAEEDVVEIVLDEGIILRYPRTKIAEFASVPATLMRDLTVSPCGSALELDAADAYVDVHGLLTSLLSPAAMAKELARHGRKTTSESQAEAARRNGQKGGRPRKQAAGWPPA
jgi:hypothetical protein